ncbi:hypothetical protein GH714_038085 [Hevea brasiliensis]|uniref:Uncharacterized protein n=1 Tax=Hevea brasiliensis TaxID=3981 RepID=A0A6A6LV14_HEVBR|nr:hypothetical protein GH714_038085 [Hevea brasiliensis]
MPPPAETEKASSLSDKMGNFQGFSPQSKGQCIEQKNTNQEGDSHQSPRKDSHRLSQTNRVDLQGILAVQQCQKMRIKKEILDDTVEHKDSPPCKPSPLTGSKVEDCFSGSSSEDGDSKGFEEVGNY